MDSREKVLWVTTSELAKHRGKSREIISRGARNGKLKTKLDKSRGGQGVRYVQIEGEEVDQYLKAKISKESTELRKSHSKSYNKITTKLNEGYNNKSYNKGLSKASVCSTILKEIEKGITPKEEIYKHIQANLPLELLQLTRKDTYSVRQLKRWVKAYEVSGRSFIALIPNYKRKDEGKQMITPDESNMLFKLLFNPNKMKIGKAVRSIKQKARAGEIDSPSSKYILKRAAEDMKIKYSLEWRLSREGENSFKNNVLKPIRRDNSSLEVGERWVSDGKKLDFEILDPKTGKPKRMTKISFMDEKSRYVVGFAIGSSEDTKTIALAFRKSIINFGRPPKSVYIDNGRAYSSNYFNGKSKSGSDQTNSNLIGLFDLLGTEVVFAEKFNAKAKSIERLNRTFHEDFEQQQPSYVGTSPKNKPATMLASENWIKDTFPRGIPTLAKAYRDIDKYFKEYYAHTPHKGLNGKTPHEVYTAGKPNRKIDERKLDYLMLDPEVRTVNKEGISYNTIDYYSSKLVHHIGQKVFIKSDLSKDHLILVYDMNNRYICQAYKSGLQASILVNESDIKRLNNERSEKKNILEDTKKSLSKHLKQNREYLVNKGSESVENDEESSPFIPKESPDIQMSEKDKILNYIKSMEGVFTIEDIVKAIKTNPGTTRKIINEYEGLMIECIGDSPEGHKEYIFNSYNNTASNKRHLTKNNHVDLEQERKKRTTGRSNKDIIKSVIMEINEAFTAKDIKDKTDFSIRDINYNLKELHKRGTIRPIKTNNQGTRSYIRESESIQMQGVISFDY